MSTNNFTFSDILEQEKIYPKDILATFQVQNIPDIINTIIEDTQLSRINLGEIGHDEKIEMTEEFIEKQKQIFIRNLIDVAEVFDLDKNYIEETISNDDKIIKIEDNYIEYFTSIIEIGLEEYITNYINIDSKSNVKKKYLLNTILLENKIDINNRSDLKQINKIKNINLEILKDRIIKIFGEYEVILEEINKYIIWKKYLFKY